MALIIEDGSRVDGANSYVTAATADEYIGTRSTSWTSAGTTAKENALIEAGIYLNSLNWKGQKYSRDQFMSFPRLNFYDEDGYLYANDVVPRRVEYAQIEAAVASVEGYSLLTNIKPTERIKRKKIVVLEKEYSPGAASQKTTLAYVDALLKGMLVAHGTLVRS